MPATRPLSAHRWLAPLGVGALLALAVYALWPEEVPDPPRSRTAPIAERPGELPAATPAADEIEPDELLVEPAVARPTPPPAPVDPCAEVEDEAAAARPGVYGLVSLRAAELDDRVRLALRREETSAELREGLLGALQPAHQDRALALLGHAPDRRVDGFDHLAAVLCVLAWQALSEDAPRRARELAGHAARTAPDDPVPLLILSLAAERDRDASAAREALLGAFRLEPHEPAIAFALARRLRNGPELDPVLDALDHYLAEIPGDPQLARLRERLLRRRAAMGRSRRLTLRGVTLVAPEAVPREVTERALSVTDVALRDAAALLGTERPEELTVFVYASHAELVAATCAQDWTAALYDGALHVDAERLASAADAATSLRHEALHAALHGALDRASSSAALRAPTWFDEGVAQYFAPEAAGPERSFEIMTRERTFVPLSSMNGAFMVIDDPRDAGLAYHQALAMVLFLVAERGERGIAEAMRYLVGGGDPDQLLAGVGAPLDGEALLSFLPRAVRPTTR